LIQERFDMEISPQDDHALLIHLETCESCQKFHHQVQQVILASEDLPLPEELLPQNLESLARKIMLELPLPHKSLISYLTQMLNRFKKNGTTKSGTVKGGSKASPFPHIKRFNQAAEAQRERKLDPQEQEQAEAISGRLRAASKSFNIEPTADSRDAQSTTRSLGEKFGLQLQPSGLLDDQPLTLADAIRRKNSESQRKEQEVSQSREVLPPPATAASNLSQSSDQAQSFPMMPNPPIGNQGWIGTNPGVTIPTPSAVGPVADNPAWTVFAGPETIGSPSMNYGPPAAANPPPNPFSALAQSGSVSGVTASASPKEPWPKEEWLNEAWKDPWTGKPAAPPDNTWQPPTAAAHGQAGNQPQIKKVDPTSPSGAAPALPPINSFAFPAAASAQSNSEPAAQMPSPQAGFNPIAGATDQAPNGSPWGTPPQFSTGAGNTGAGNAGAGWLDKSEISPNVAPIPILKLESDSGYGTSPSAKPPAAKPSLWNENQSFGVWETTPLEPAKAPPAKLPHDLSLANPGARAIPGSEQGQTPLPSGLTNQPNAVGNVDNNFLNQTTDWGSFATSLSITPSNLAAPPASPVIKAPEDRPPELSGWGAAMTTAGPDASASSPQLRTKLPAWSIEAEQVETGTWKAYVPEENLTPSAPPIVKPDGPDFSSYPIAESLFNSRIEDESEWEMPIQEKLARQRASGPLPEAKPTLPLDTFQPPPAPSQTFPIAGGQPGAIGQAGANNAPLPVTPSLTNSPWSIEIAPPVNLPPAITKGKADEPGEAYAKPIEVLSGRAANIPDAALWGLDTDEVANTKADAGMNLQSIPINQSPSLEELKTPFPTGAWGQPPKAIEPVLGAPSPFNAGTWPAVEAVPGVFASPSAPTPALPTPAPIADAASSFPAPPPTEIFATPQAALKGQLPKITPVPVKNSPIAPPQRTAETPKNVPSKPPQGQSTYPPFAAPLASPPPAPLDSSGSLSNTKAPSAAPAKDFATPGSSESGPPPASAPESRSISPHAGLFNLDDKEVDKIFESLGVTERSLPASPVQQNAAPSMSPPPSVPDEPEPANFNPSQPFPLGPSQYGSLPKAEPDTANVADQGRLFSIDDKIIDRIFADNLGIRDGAAVALPKVSKVTVSEAVKQISDAALAAPIPPPKIEGLGRLDSRPEMHNDSGSGRISSIGKFLLDGKDLEKIGKITSSDLTHTTMRILPMEAAMELHSLLQSVGSQPKVLGSVIIGKDGLLIANTMPAEIDGEQLGVWALAVYMNTQNAARKLGNERVYQIVLKTPRGYLVIADFGSGLLVTVSDARETDALVPLMRTITQLVAS